MNCDDLKNYLADGEPLPGAVADHLGECPACRAMMAALDPPQEMPNEQRLEQLAKRLTATAQPVRPLPSDSKMVLIALALFAAFSFLATLPFGFDGFQRLTAVQKTWYYAAVLLVAILFSAATVKEIIPGARKLIHPLWLTAGSVLLLAVSVTAVIPDFGLNNFRALGLPCLRLALSCAAICGFLASWFFRRGYPTAPVQASLTFGVFAGLSGVAVLALHCPVLNAPHILIWHLGALPISGLVGAGIGSLIYKPGKFAEEL